MLIFSREGKSAWLQFLIDRGLVLKLFTNDRHPTRLDRQDAYTEQRGQGYVPIVLLSYDWVIDEIGPTAATSLRKTWQFTGPLGEIWGCYLTFGGRFLGAERFSDGPYKVLHEGDRIGVVVTLSMP